eukprot:3699903-Prymnesium_polylepis.1
MLDGFKQACEVECNATLTRTSTLYAGEVQACELMAEDARVAAADGGASTSGAEATGGLVLTYCKATAARVLQAARADCVDGCMDNSYDAPSHTHFPASCTRTKNASHTSDEFWAANREGCVAAAKKPRPGQAKFQDFVTLEGHLTTAARGSSLIFAIMAASSWP